MKQVLSCNTVSNLLDQPDRNHPGTSRLDTLFSKIASLDHGEFLGMASDLNLIKGSLYAGNWRGSDPVAWSGEKPENNMAKLVQVCMIIDMINHPRVRANWKITHGRVYETIQNFYLEHNSTTNEWARGLRGPDNTRYTLPGGREDPENSYEVWLTSRLNTNNALIAQNYNRILSELTNTKPEWVAFKTSFMSRYPVASMTLLYDMPSYQERACHRNKLIGKRQAGANAGDDEPGCAWVTPPAPLATAIGAAGTSVGLAPPVPQYLEVADPGAGVVSDRASTYIPISVTTPLVPGNGFQVKPNQRLDGATPAVIPIQTTPPVVPTLIATPKANTTSPASIATMTPLTSSSAIATTSAIPDPCGPKQQYAEFFNTCNAPLKRVESPSWYGALPQTYGLDTDIVNWANCHIAYQQMCSNLASINALSPHLWVWCQDSGCAVGVWLPGAAPGNARLPTQAECETNIFKAMADIGASMPTKTDMVSVNLATVPSWKEPSVLGSQVAAGYPSYIIAPRHPKGLGAEALGYTSRGILFKGQDIQNEISLDKNQPVALPDPEGNPDPMAAIQSLLPYFTSPYG